LHPDVVCVVPFDKKKCSLHNRASDDNRMAIDKLCLVVVS